MITCNTSYASSLRVVHSRQSFSKASYRFPGPEEWIERGNSQSRLMVIDSALNTNRRFSHVRVPNDRSAPCWSGKSMNVFNKYSKLLLWTYVTRFSVLAPWSFSKRLVYRRVDIYPVLKPPAGTYEYSEHQLLTTLGVDNRLLRARRYIDDLQSVFAFDRTSFASRKKAECLAQNLLRDCYPPSLVLEQVELAKNANHVSYRFLEAKNDYDRQNNKRLTLE